MAEAIAQFVLQLSKKPDRAHHILQHYATTAEITFRPLSSALCLFTLLSSSKAPCFKQAKPIIFALHFSKTPSSCFQGTAFLASFSRRKNLKGPILFVFELMGAKLNQPAASSYSCDSCCQRLPSCKWMASWGPNDTWPFR